MPAFADRAFAVDNVSLSIAPGETLCVVGESGSGKSMLAHAVMGLLPKEVKPARGSIWIDKRDLLTFDESAMRNVRGREIGMIFQEPMTSLNPIMPAGRQIEETFEAHGALDRAQRARVLDLLAEVGLPDPAHIAHAYPHELSGGQRQRVMIAMALALQPRLLIADEPTTALDVTTQAQILKLIAELRRKHGTAVLFITHDFGVVADIADRIVVLQNGVAVEQGIADDVLARPQHAYTRRLIAAVPSLQPPERPIEPPKPPVLVVEGLGKTYRKTSLLQPTRTVTAATDISFTLARGETLGLVGEFGSGKSTIGRCCIRLIEPDTGRVLLNGVALNELSRAKLRAQRSRIQMVFQDPYASLNPRQTYGRIIADPLESWPERRRGQRRRQGSWSVTSDFQPLRSTAIRTNSPVASASASALRARLRSSPTSRLPTSRLRARRLRAGTRFRADQGHPAQAWSRHSFRDT